MAILWINAHEGRPWEHHGNGTLFDELARVGRTDGPAIVLIHGYKYQPGHPDHCPHKQIFSLDSENSWNRTSGWLRQLGFGTGHPAERLAVAFGWGSRGAIWHVQRQTRSAGLALARTAIALRRQSAQRPVHILAHSLGSELAFEAMHHLPEGAIDRIIVMTGASYQGRAMAALGTPAGRTAEVINGTSRENDVFDFLFERLIPPVGPDDRAIGNGLTASNAVTLQLDCADTLVHLDRLGLPVGPPERRVCHWSAYTRPGILRVYHDLFRHRDALPLNLLRRGLPERSAPRWSRLLAPMALPRVLPFAQKPS